MACDIGHGERRVGAQAAVEQHLLEPVDDDIRQPVDARLRGFTRARARMRRIRAERLAVSR